jgi:hypothetical protein
VQFVDVHHPVAISTNEAPTLIVQPRLALILVLRMGDLLASYQPLEPQSIPINSWLHLPTTRALHAQKPF